MQFIFYALLLLTITFNSSGLFAHHQHHSDNPPCNHETLQEARDAHHHSH